MLIYYKKQGEILGDITKRLSADYSKISFVGRLDPMASGIIAFTTNEECYNQNNFLQVTKNYRFNLIIGISTDTGDCLGKIKNIQNNFSNFKYDDIIKYFNNRCYLQEYPIYSSYKIRKNGMKKPLWYFAKNHINLLPSDIPKHMVYIHKLDYDPSQIFYINNSNYFIEQIEKLPDGLDFRKEEIIQQYSNINTEVIAVPMVAKVSGGTYIRKLCEDIGDKIGISCMADKIERISYNFPADAAIKEMEIRIDNYED